MNSYLKQSTAAQSRAIGPFVDDTDFKTAETGLTIANTDIKLIINGAASADKNSGGGTHRANGVYGITFDATDTATVGEMMVSIKVAGALAVFHTFIVVEEAVYDALFAASAPGYVANAPVNVAQFGGSNGTFSGGRPEVNTSHVGGTLQTGRDIGASVLLSSGTGTGQVKLASGYIAPNWGDIGNPTTTVNLSGTTVKTATDVETKVDTVDTVVDAIKAKTDNLPTDPADQSLIIAATDALATLIGDVPTNAELATALAAADDAVLAAIAALNNLSQANIRTAVGLASANLDTQLGDLPTNSELTAALASADDAVLAAIAALNNLSQANIRTAVGLASANLDTQLGDLPTNSELATALTNLDAAVSSRAAAATALSTVQWTNTRAGYLDNLNALKVKKNSALANFTFLMVLSSDHVTPATGKTVTATRSIDGASFGACANSVTEVANGVYKISLAAADLNGDVITLKFTHADCDQRTIVIATQP